MALLDKGFDQLADHVGHFFGLERRSHHARQLGMIALLAAQRHLIPFFAILIDPQHADIADVVMAAGIDTTRDIQRQVTQIVDEIEVIEARLNALRNRNRLGIGQRTKIAARAGNDIRQQTDIRRGKIQSLGA